MTPPLPRPPARRGTPTLETDATSLPLPASAKPNKKATYCVNWSGWGICACGARIGTIGYHLPKTQHGGAVACYHCAKDAIHAE